MLYLIGGSSSVGKTVLASAVADRLHAEILHLDELVGRMTDPIIAFPAGISDVWDLPSQQLRDGLIAKGEALTPVLQDIVSEQVGERDTVIEGEGIHPGLARRWIGDRRVHCVFVVEEDVARLLETLRGRSGSPSITESVRLKVAGMNALYGSWLRREAMKYGLRCLPSQPWDTLPERFYDSPHNRQIDR